MMPSFAEKTMASVTSALQSTIFAEDTARGQGLLQSIDPRAKVVSFLALLLCIALARRVEVLVALYLFTLALAALSRVALRTFLKRVWFFIPLFTGVVALPALFITPGPPLIVIIDLPYSPVYLAITETGLRAAAYLLLRVAGSVSLAVLLVMTTPWWPLLRALRILRVPQSFILVISMTYRYIFLLLRLSEAMFLARESRAVGRLSAQDNRRFLGAALGTLLSRSYDLSNEVYLAMMARGFRGEVALAEASHPTWRDGLFALTALGAIAAVWLAEAFLV